MTKGLGLVALVFLPLVLLSCREAQRAGFASPQTEPTTSLQPAETEAAPIPTALSDPTRVLPSATEPTPVLTAMATEVPGPEPTETSAGAEVVEATATLLPASPTIATRAVPGEPARSIQLVPRVSGGLRNPLYATHAFDERLFVVEKAGRIRIIEEGDLLPEPFLDIQDRVSTSANEQGLLSLAFHPQVWGDGPGRGVFFVNYTDLNGDTVVSRFHVSSDNSYMADPGSEVIVLTVEQPYGNHNGGQLQFGRDGYLYVGMGDGGSGGDPHGHGQNRGTLLGAMLRLDVNVSSESGYAIPPDNPFVGEAAARGEIWAYGLRNPWRFSFDRLTGDLFIADVGQNQWEEVNFQPAGSTGGENYGWNILEASHCFTVDNCDTSGLIQPIFEYDHGAGCSITGGFVYRGSQFPELSGNYFLADFCSGIIWSLFRELSGTWTANRVLESGLRIAGFGEDAAGEIYVLDYGGGQVLQLQPG